MRPELNSSSVNVFKISQSQLDGRPIFFSDINFFRISFATFVDYELVSPTNKYFGDLKGRF